MAEISIELKLAIADAINQAKAAASAISKEFGAATTKGTTAATSSAATAGHDKETVAIQKKTKALTEQQKVLEAWRKANAGGIAPSQKITIASQTAGKGMTGNPFQAEVNAWKGSLATAAAELTKAPALMNLPGYKGIGMAQRIINMKPALPNVAFPTLPHAPAAPKATALNGTLLRSLIGSVAGSSLAGPIGAGLGASAMGASGPFAIAIGAATAGMKLLRHAIDEVVDAANRARTLYAKTMTSGGFAPGYVVRQNILAGILGVSEDQVMQYGRAIGFIGKRAEWAAKTTSDNMRLLTAEAWEAKIVAEDAKAAWSNLAVAVEPSMMKFYEWMDKIIKKAGSVVKEMSNEGKNEAKYAAFEKWAEKHGVAYSGVHVRGQDDLLNMGINKQGEFGPTNKKILKLFEDEFNKISSKNLAPAIPTNINRMPSSAWEKMGMVLGMGGRTDHAAVTAKGVTTLVALTQKLVQQRNSINHDSFANPMAAMA